MLTVGDRVEISTGLKEGWSIRAIAAHIDRGPSVVSREVRRSATNARGYTLVTADCTAWRRRRRPQVGKVAADEALRTRVLASLSQSRTPRQVAGRLRLEAQDETVGLMKGSRPAEGKTASPEAIYRFIYALPTNDLARHGVLLRSKRTHCRPRKPLAECGAPIVGMSSIDARQDIDDRRVPGHDRRVPGHWEGDLTVGAHGRTAAATLVERTTRFTVILALADGKDSEHWADTLITTADELPVMMRKSLTWDQGSEMAKHAALTLVTAMPVYFAHPRSPWERGTNENTNGLIREYLPKNTQIPAHQPYLTSIAEELNERPRAVLGYPTRREAFHRLLTNTVASTP